MLKSERIIGIIYLPLHIFVLPTLLIFLIPQLFRHSEAASVANINLILYVISFLFIFIFLFRYLKSSFSDLFANILNTVKAIVLAYLFYYAVSMLFSSLLSLFLQETANPNTREIINQTKLNANTMIIIAVLLAPVVEETLFRGALFGTIRTKSRVAAYIVSVLLFSAYHLWQPLVYNFEWSLLLYLLQYIPASIALCWCYEKSGSIWAPIVLHALINFIQIRIVIG
jgi:membrane protease YdiL (CAAX protease family)